jgi:hypothetical protein
MMRCRVSSPSGQAGNISGTIHDNELKMSAFLTDRPGEIEQRMGLKQIAKHPRTGKYSVMPYQTTHTCSGAIMDDDPKASALNQYLQSQDIPNLFVFRLFGKIPAAILPGRWLRSRIGWPGYSQPVFKRSGPARAIMMRIVRFTRYMTFIVALSLR